MAYEKIKYNNEYTQKHYYSISVCVAKGCKKPLVEIAQERNIPLSQIVKDALSEVYGIEFEE